MKQLVFRKELVFEFLNKVKSEDRDFIEFYFNKDVFEYPFQDDDLIASNIPKVDDNLGQQLVDIHLKNALDNRIADFECAKHLYESLELTPAQASNQQFWNYLHHVTCYPYIHKRWDRIKNPERGGTAKYIERHWLMPKTSQKHLINATLSALWWSIHITIDENRADKYELSKVYFDNNRVRTVSIGGNSFARHKPAMHGLLEYILENEIDFLTEFGDDVGKYINLLGGTKPLSYFEKDWFKRKLYEKFGRGDKYKENIETTNKKESDDKVEEVIDLKEEGRVLKYFNLNDKGEYKLTNQKQNDFKYSLPIYDKFKNGHLLLCYNEFGYINRVTISSLLQRNRDSYINGIYKGNTINNLLIVPRNAIIGILFKKGGKQYFKAFFTHQFKKDNDNVGLQGYKTMYQPYDEIEYMIIPYELKNSIRKLMFKSFNAAGKDVSNHYYKKEFAAIYHYINKSKSRLT